MVNTHYATTPIIGANFAAIHDAPQFKLGTTLLGSDGTEWVYVKATTALTQYDCAGVDEDYNAVPITSTLARAGYIPGFAQVAFTVNYYGWVALKGANISVRIKASCAADVQLYTSATAGVLDDTNTTTSSAIRGVVVVVAGTSATISSREALASFPSATATP